MFGREKVSKCKELITNVKRRLELLTYDKHCITRRSRSNVVQFLKHHEFQAALAEAEKIYKNESMVEIYDLLDYYCDVVARNLSYISKHKNCPDYLKEAISTLIYASGKFDDLPELCSIGRLLGKRYGKKIVTTALELRAGNYVKFRRQIYEVLNMNYVHDYVKYKLLKEIESSCDPVTVEYRPCLEEEKVIERDTSKVSSCEEKNVIGILRCRSRGTSTCKVSSCEEETVNYVDIACETMQYSDDSLESSEILEFLEHCYDDEDSASESETFVFQLPKNVIYLDDIEEIVSPVSNEEDSASELETSFVQSPEKGKYYDDVEEIASPVSNEEDSASELETSFVKSPEKVKYYDDIEEIASPVSNEEDSASEMETSFVQSPEKVKYYDDIEEIASPLSKERILQDQRSFEFKPSNLTLKEETYKRSYNDLDERIPSRNSLKMRRAGRNRSRRTMVSVENIFDFESALYYGYL